MAPRSVSAADDDAHDSDRMKWYARSMEMPITSDTGHGNRVAYIEHAKRGLVQQLPTTGMPAARIHRATAAADVPCER